VLVVWCELFSTFVCAWCVCVFVVLFWCPFFVFFGCFSAYLGKSGACVFLSRGWVGGVRFCVFQHLQNAGIFGGKIFLVVFWLRRVVIGVVCILGAPVVVLHGDSAVFLGESYH
jgi:hypothetical protein